MGAKNVLSLVLLVFKPLTMSLYTFTKDGGVYAFLSIWLVVGCAG